MFYFCLKAFFKAKIILHSLITIYSHTAVIFSIFFFSIWRVCLRFFNNLKMLNPYKILYQWTQSVFNELRVWESHTHPNIYALYYWHKQSTIFIKNQNQNQNQKKYIYIIIHWYFKLKITFIMPDLPACCAFCEMNLRRGGVPKSSAECSGANKRTFRYA